MPAGNLSVYRGTVAYATGKFGNARSAALVSGMMDDFLGTPGTQATLGTGTIEFWCKIPSASALRVIAGHMAWWWIGHDASGNLICYVGASTGEGGLNQIQLTFPATNLTTGSPWWHIALVFNAGVASLYAGTSGTGNRLAVAGAAVGGSNTLNTDGTVGIGGFDESTYGSYDLPAGGLVDEFRSSTVARYSGTTYTVPTGPFTYDADTYGIWHFDGDLNKASSDVPVTPTAPTFTDPAGTGSDTYTIPTTTGVNYQIAGSTVAAGTYAGTGTVTITAVAQAGYVISGTSSWSYTFATTTSVTATAPTFTDPSGTSSDTYTIPTTVGVNYQVAGVTKAAGTYPGSGTLTVTAVAQSGFTLTGTTSWTYTFSTTAAPVYKWRIAHEPLVHSGGSYPTRPAGAKSVTWIGPSTPPGWLPNDIWVDNS